MKQRCALRTHALVASVAFWVGCGAELSPPPVTCPGEGDYEFADMIVDAPGHVKTPSAIDIPENAINGVVTGNRSSGSLDVYSRGLSTDPPNHYIVLRWSGRRVVNGDGPDIVVFENAFETRGGVFMDHAIVEVSNDGESWVAFPHDYVADDETKYSRNPDDWVGFAGTTPVAWRSETCSSPYDESAGGDRFDLSDLDHPELQRGFSFLRLTAAPTQLNPDTGELYPRDILSDGFDLDGVFAANTEQE